MSYFILIYLAFESSRQQEIANGREKNDWAWCGRWGETLGASLPGCFDWLHILHLKVI